MDSNMSTAAYMHRHGGSPSTSSTSTGSSSGGAGGTPGGNPTGGGRVAVIGVTRNVRLRRRGASGFGFSLRGGREYSAGFYVSDVQPGGEAHRNGLRVGDQIVRVNGYPVEDAVHQEVALLAKNQQVLVLKIRSVGMIPVKDNPNDPVTWHIVQQQQQLQLQANETASGTVPPSTEVRIRIPVGEKGRLGCGVCRGILPGLTVQGTREGGPARAAGLKAGDVIIWCNGQRLTDLPFERAIEVMRGAAILDLIVNRPVPNHLYDCPESLWMRGSSGYDSESSSSLAVSPPPQVPTSPQHLVDGRTHQGRDEPTGRNGRICCPLAISTGSCSSSEWNHVDQVQEWTRKPNNTTVIRVNQNQNQNLYQRNIQNHSHPASRGNVDNLNKGTEPLYDPVAPRIDYEVHDFDRNIHEQVTKRPYQRDKGPIIHDGPVERNSQPEGNQLAELQFVQRQVEMERKTLATVEVHQTVSPPAPPSMPPPLSYKWQPDAKPMNAMGMQMGSTMSMGSTGSTETESSLESSCSKDSASTSSSLSTSSCEPASTASFVSNGTSTTTTMTNKISEGSCVRPARITATRNSPVANTDLGTAIAQELQRRAQQRSMNNAGKGEAGKEKVAEMRKVQTAEALRVQEQKVTHDKLMEEFKRAHRRMFNVNQQRVQFSDQVEQEQERRLTNGSSSASGPPPPPPPLPVTPARTKNSEDAVEMQSIESFKLKDAPSFVIPKPPPTYFPLTANSTSSTTTSTTSSVAGKLSPASGSPRHGPVSVQSAVNGKESVSNAINESNKFSLTSPTANGQNAKPIGKVAIRIGAYEGEAKQPSRLEFLPQQQRTLEKGNGEEDVANAPVVSRLQNELAATLQRSNLRKKTDEDNSMGNVIPKPPAIPEITRPITLSQNNVEKLASVLSNKVTIKVSPENATR
ncbi:uncharacterized protein LOC107266919 [Cephus cinctus]|uniref:Uncharacterized protein LOC107266919 n=1 Tax=Cephus cinctus TaxID=211228 RepID=A0AAJ7BTL6_CEPCN|nr:uncharacterized protein LOC107266919 [Cephus cinctus]